MQEQEYLNEIRKAWTHGRQPSTRLIWKIQQDLKVSEQEASDMFFNSVAEYEED
jgi:hypothetical protein